MRPVEFGEALPPGTRLTLFSDDKPDRFFTVIEFSIDKTLGAAFNFEAGIPSYRVQDEEGRIQLLVNMPIDEERTDEWWLWRPDQAVMGPNQFFRGH